MYKGWETFNYLDWLVNLVEYEELNEDVARYYIYALHEIPFEYSIERDENRAYDGIKLRTKYMEEMNIPSMFYGDETECSVLEMLVALSVRCCEDLMGAETPGFWFWDWMRNLFGRFICNEAYIQDKVGTWLDRKFDKRGFGSPFPLRKGRVRDQRKVEIWLQMCGYISENFVGLD